MYQLKTVPCRAALLIWLAAIPFASSAEEMKEETWNAHVQTTYIWQTKPSFSAPYSGDYSVRTEGEKAYSISATAAFGVRPWTGGELYFGPEVVQGMSLSQLHGLGGLTNGEQQKTSGPNPTFYRARLFLRQSWNLGGEKVAVESDANRLRGMLDSRRLVLSVGNLAVSDIFDNNAYAHDARSQFMNWALLTHGAYDFAADARGYSWGMAGEYDYDDWAFRMGRFTQPLESNGLVLDSRIFKHYGDQLEAEHGHTWLGQPGRLRLLAFRNRASMGGFRDALADAQSNGGTPDVSRVRKERAKIGFGINAEQNLNPDLGVFFRASWNDGASETYAFAEIERSISAGVAVKGGAWDRSKDTFGLAFVRNGLSQAHRDYLAAGGHGAFIGDGKLNYRPESIVELYYSLQVTKYLAVSLDAQHIVNPAYNADRGPVNVGSLRLHAQY